MNQLLPYEQLLAEKIQQAPVADMADAIWANIQQELDSDPSQDPDHEPEPPSSPGGGGAPGMSFYFYIAASVVVTALVLIFALPVEKKVPIQPSASPAIEEIRTNEIPAVDSSRQVTTDNKQPIIPVIAPLRDTSTQSATNDLTFNDSLFNQPLSRIVNDSINIKDNARLGEAVTRIIDSSFKQKVIPQKKPKGVPGITDDDYRLKTVPKDSTRKGD